MPARRGPATWCGARRAPCGRKRRPGGPGSGFGAPPACCVRPPDPHRLHGPHGRERHLHVLARQAAVDRVQHFDQVLGEGARAQHGGLRAPHLRRSHQLHRVCAARRRGEETGGEGAEGKGAQHEREVGRPGPARGTRRGGRPPAPLHPLGLSRGAGRAAPRAAGAGAAAGPARARGRPRGRSRAQTRDAPVIFFVLFTLPMRSRRTFRLADTCEEEAGCEAGGRGERTTRTIKAPAARLRAKAATRRLRARAGAGVTCARGPAEARPGRAGFGSGAAAFGWNGERASSEPRSAAAAPLPPFRATTSPPRAARRSPWKAEAKGGGCGAAVRPWAQPARAGSRTGSVSTMPAGCARVAARGSSNS